MDYSDRKLLRVRVNYLELTKEETNGVSGTVNIEINNHLGDGEGPIASLHLNVPFDPSKSIREAELALIDGAVALQKMASLNRQELIGRLMSEHP